jgi:hypothetical protein
VAKNKKSREPRLQVAPEFSGSGLATALGNNPAGEVAPAAANDAATDDWTVFGIDIVAQMAAENAARAAGQSLGEWLSALIDAATADKK